MNSRQVWLSAAMMVSAAVLGRCLVPTQFAAERDPLALDSMIPAQFGPWRFEPAQGLVVQSPQQEALLSSVYSQVLMRVYRRADGARIMLSVAYSRDQRGNSNHQVHYPEVCYPAQGFTLHERSTGEAQLRGVAIPVVRMVATQGARVEPLTYWVTVGGTPENSKLKLKLDQLRASLLHGVVEDGLIFRVSEIEPNVQRGYTDETAFLNDLYRAVDRPARHAFFGLNR